MLTYAPDELDLNSIMSELLAVSYTYGNLRISYEDERKGKAIAAHLANYRLSVKVHWTSNRFLFLELHLHLLPLLFSLQLEVHIHGRGKEERGHG